MGESGTDEIGITGFSTRAKTSLLVGVFVLGYAVYLVTLAVPSGGYPPGRWIAGGGATVFATLGTLSVYQGLRGRRPLAVRGDALVVNGAWRRIAIPLSELSGVGVVFTWMEGRGGRPPGWYLMIWDGSGQGHLVEESALKVDRTQAETLDWSPPRETSNEVAASDPGKLARRIYDRVWAVQGSSGPLATRQAQKMRDSTVWTRPVNTLAFWSPDGELGVFAKSAPADLDD